MNLAKIYYLHEIGAKKKQEDYIWPAPGTASLDDRIFIVCDGVGGSQNGEIASRIVSESVGNSLLKTTQAKISTSYINQLLSEAKAKLLHYARANGLSADMATTFSLLIFINEKAFISWCGDSRVYHIRRKEIIFKTEDHSLVNTLVRNGEITSEEALAHPQKNIILKAIKADDAEPEADGYWVNDIQDGDYFMLCTDGLLENIGERDLKFLLDQNEKGDIDLVQSFQQFCYNKTNDNYSMYLIKVKAESRRFNPVRVTMWLLLLLCLAGAAVFLTNKQYFSKKKSINMVMPVNREKEAIDTMETMKLNTGNDSETLKKDPDPPKIRKDSVQAHKSESQNKIKDSLK